MEKLGISSELIFKVTSIVKAGFMMQDIIEEKSPLGALYVILLAIFLSTELFGEPHGVCGQCGHISHSIYAVIYYRKQICHYLYAVYHCVLIWLNLVNPLATSSNSIMTVLTVQSVIDFPFSSIIRWGFYEAGTAFYYVFLVLDLIIYLLTQKSI